MRDIENEINKLRYNKWLPAEFEISEDIKECIANCTSPDKKDIFKAFTLFKPEETRILILGQDPYPNPERAHGLAFSFENSKPADDSLLNIYKAIEECKKANNVKIEKEITEWATNLEKWATTNKVLLLNTALTHENTDESTIKKHTNAWEPFVKQIISNLINSKINTKDTQNNELAVFLWGKSAQNIFFQSLNNEIFWNSIIFNTNLAAFKNKNKKQFNKVSLVHQCSNLQLTSTIKMYLTYHPSNRYPKGAKNFINDSPNHFKACDDFLGRNKDGEYTWKNFPEKNEKH